jgi:hypothetical protein
MIINSTLECRRPLVELGGSDAQFEIGPYRFLYFSTHIQPWGLISYRHLLVALDPEDNDRVWVGAETNDQEGESVIYLGRFMALQHATITQSPGLVHAEFFVPVACQVAREVLDLPYDRYPLTPAEDAGIAAIPGVFEKHYPQGITDEAMGTLMAKLMEAVLVSNMVGFDS